MIDVTYDAEGAWKGRYGCFRGLKWVHVRAYMGSHERAVMGLESQAVYTRVTKHFLLFLGKHVINGVISLPNMTSCDNCFFFIL